MSDGDLDIYLNWLSQHGGSFDKLRLEMDTDGNGRSVYATQTVNADDAIATVPFKIALTETRARQEFPQLGGFSCRVVLSLFVAYQKALGTSFYAPYLDILPTNIKTPFFFDANDMKYLQHTNLASAVQERMTSIRSDYDKLMTGYVNDNVKNMVTWDLFLWAHCVISSRSFPYRLIDPSDTSASEVLFPLVDSLNHKPNTKITWTRCGDAETGSLVFVSGQSFAAGEQVFNNYGPKSNEELLLGYGFCLDNNEADHIALKPNLTRDPLGQDKLKLAQQYNIASGNADPLTHYIHRKHIPLNYFKMMRIFVMNSSELHLYGQCTDANRLTFVGYRNELAMLSVTIQLLQGRLLAIKGDNLDRDHPTWWQRFALIYRDGQEYLYQHTLEIMKVKKAQVLSQMKSALDRECFTPLAPFVELVNSGFFESALTEREASTSPPSFVPLESVTITLKRLLDADREFKDVIDQLFEDIEEEEDVVFMLALIHESTKQNSAWLFFFERTEVGSAQHRDDQVIEDLQQLYDSLFPAFSDAFPTVFDANVYTFDKLLWAENILSNYTVDNPLAIVPI